MEGSATPSAGRRGESSEERKLLAAGPRSPVRSARMASRSFVRARVAGGAKDHEFSVGRPGCVEVEAFAAPGEPAAVGLVAPHRSTISRRRFASRTWALCFSESKPGWAAARFGERLHASRLLQGSQLGKAASRPSGRRAGSEPSGRTTHTWPGCPGSCRSQSKMIQLPGSHCGFPPGAK
jgi:hypothetical protein